MQQTWLDWALDAQPSLFLGYLRDLGSTFLIPELHALIGCPQQVDHHPEGDVWNHTLMVCDQAALIADREDLFTYERIILLFAALTHDFGKPATTVIHDDGRITAYDHPQKGVESAYTFLRNIGMDNTMIAHVIPLVREHMVHVFYFTPEITTRVVKRLMMRLEPATVKMLSYLVEADASGRGGQYYQSGLPVRMQEILYLAENIDTDIRPDYIITGDHLIELGFMPGKQLGVIKEAAYQAQLRGDFHTLEGGIAWILSNITAE